MTRTTITSFLWIALATFCSTASATSEPMPPPANQWQQIGIVTSEEFYNHRENLSASTGSTLYFQANIPAGAKRMRIELIGANGNADLVVRNGSPVYPADCERRAVGSNELCETNAPAAGTRFIEVQSRAAFTGLRLVVAYQPAFKPLTSVTDDWLPIAIAKRPVWHSPPRQVEGCMHVNFESIGSSVSKLPCMPVGNQQTWRVQKTTNDEFRLLNQYGTRCLAVNLLQQNGVVEDLDCATDDAKQRWRLQGGGGSEHYVALQNVASGLCADFDATGAHVLQKQCRLAEGDGPAWHLLDMSDRMSQAMDGATFQLAGGNLCLGDNGTSVFLADCGDRTVTRRMFSLIPTKWHDWWDGSFELRSHAGDKCVAVQRQANGKHTPFFAVCDGLVSSQRWKLETADNHHKEWQLRNVGTKHCLTPQDGIELAGTPLVVADCAPVDKKNKWKYLGT